MHQTNIIKHGFFYSWCYQRLCDVYPMQCLIAWTKIDWVMKNPWPENTKTTCMADSERDTVI